MRCRYLTARKLPPLETTTTTAPAPWLIRIPEVFAELSGEILDGLEADLSKKLGSEYFLVRSRNPVALRGSAFLRWNLPVEHAWPCHPETMDGFVEKAAQALYRKFGPRDPQAIFIGQLDPSATNRYYKALASNLRGRTLQLFPPAIASFKDVEAQQAGRETLFGLVGKEGLFCGMQSPRDCNGFYPGGTKFIGQSSPDTISRAGAKIAEALHYLPLHRPLPRKGSHWLELGASPGGMTSELLGRGYQVTAIDRAPLDPRLDRQPGLNFARLDVAAFRPNASMTYDAILSDMNGDPRESIHQVGRLAGNLKPGGLAIFTLKTTGAPTFPAMNELLRSTVSTAKEAGLRLFAKTHLTYNRQELTLFFEASPVA